MTENSAMFSMRRAVSCVALWFVSQMLLSTPAHARLVYRRVSIPFTANQIGEILTFRVFKGGGYAIWGLRMNGTTLIDGGAIWGRIRAGTYRYGVGQYCSRSGGSSSNNCNAEKCDPVEEPRIGRLRDDGTIYEDHCPYSGIAYPPRYFAYPVDHFYPWGLREFIQYSGSGVLDINFDDQVPDTIAAPTIEFDTQHLLMAESTNPRIIRGQFRLAELVSPHDRFSISVSDAEGKVIREVFLGHHDVTEVTDDPTLLDGQIAKTYTFAVPILLLDGESFLRASVNDAAGQVATATIRLNSRTLVTVPRFNGCEATENHVILNNGNHVNTETDMVVNGGEPLEETRTQNSTDQISSQFGKGQSSTYDYRLFEIVSNGEEKVTIRTSNGTRHKFTRNGAGYSPECNCSHLSLAKDATGQFTLSETTGQLRRFDSSGFLKAVVSPRGSVTALAYDGQHRLARVTNAYGQSINFSYGANCKVESIRDDVGRTVYYAYDKDDQLVVTTDPDGYKKSYDYDQSGRLIRVTDGDGRQMVAVRYDALGRVQEVTEGGEVEVGGQVLVQPTVSQFAYNPLSGQTTKVTVGGGTTVTAYNEQGRTTGRTTAAGTVQYVLEPGTLNVQSETDALGRVTSFQHDVQGYPTQIQAPDDAVLTIDRQIIAGVSRPTRFLYPSKKEAVLNYNPDGTLASYTPPDSGTLILEYSSDAQVTRVLSADGHEVKSTHNSHGQPTSYTFGSVNDPASQASVSMAYDAAGNVKEFTDTRGIKTKVTHDQRGLPVTVENALQQVTTLDRDSAGNVKATIDPLNRRSEATFDSQGRPLTTKNALGQLTLLAYNSQGLLAAVENFRGERWVTTHDEVGRVASMTDPAGGVYQIDYNAASEVVAMRDPLLREVIFERDQRGRVKKQTNPGGSFRTMTYHPDGQLKTQTDELGRTTSFVVDGFGRVTEITDPVGDTERFFYTSSGQLQTYTDALGRVTTYEYNPLGQLTTVKPPSGGAFNVQAAEYKSTLDTEGNLTAFKPPVAGTWSYQRDALGRVTEETDPNGKVRKTVYDAGGRVKRVEEPGDPDPIVTTIGYDDLDRPTSIQSPDRTMTVTYRDALNEVETHILPQDTRIIRKSDALGRLVQETTIRMVGGVEDTVKLSYAYDRASNLTAVLKNGTLIPTGDGGWIFSGGSLQTGYVYDERDRPTRVIDYVTNEVVFISYDAAGQVKEITYQPSGMTQGFTYTRKGEVETTLYKNGAGVPIRRLTYARDAGSQILEVIDEDFSQPADQVAYDWDARGRVRRAESTDGSYVEEIDYDPDSNITRQKVASPAINRVRTLRYGASDELLDVQEGATTSTLSYDARGNLIGMMTSGPSGTTVKTFEWDSESRLVRVAVDGAMRFEGDYLGGYELSEERTPSKQLLHTWFAGNIVASRSAASFEEVDRSLTMPGLLDRNLARGPPNDRKILVTDQLSSTLGETDSVGGVVGERRYTLYGEVREGDAADGVGFHGARFQEEAGLYYLRNRWYEPGLGRFLSRDPDGFGSGTNLQAFVSANPIAFRDPAGLFLDPVTTTGRAVVGAGAGALVGGLIGGVVGGWSGFKRGIVSGGAAGAAAGVTFGWSLAAGAGANGAIIMSGAFGSGSASFVDSLLQEKSAGEIAVNTGAGFAIGGLLGGASIPLSRYVSKLVSCAPAAESALSGPLGSLTAAEIESAMTGSTVRIVTKLTQPPQAGRALSAAVGDASEALANVSRLEGEVFIAEVPRSLLKQLERVGLVEIKITIMNGARATEFRFAPQAMDILASFFSPGGL